MEIICCHENVLTETSTTKQPRFYYWLHYFVDVFTEALPNNVLLQLVPETCFDNPLSSNVLFRHNIKRLGGRRHVGFYLIVLNLPEGSLSFTIE
jgi:hypothetical protein